MFLTRTFKTLTILVRGNHHAVHNPLLRQPHALIHLYAESPAHAMTLSGRQPLVWFCQSTHHHPTHANLSDTKPSSSSLS